MKYISFICGIVFSLASATVNAEIALKGYNSVEINGAITQKAEKEGLANIDIDSKQTFMIVKDGTNIGTLIQGRGWLRNVHPVCFVGWSTDNININFFMQTIGVDDWETADCDKIESVGVISKSNDSEPKIAVIYTVDTRGETSKDYVILGIRNENDVFYDKKITEKFQNSYIKDISGLRKAYRGE